MFALLLGAFFGWRAGAGELMAELAICALLLGGGGGRRARVTLTRLMPRRLRTSTAMS